MKKQIENGETDKEHIDKLIDTLSNINGLMAFDKALEEIYTKDPEAVRGYIEGLVPVFSNLTLEYGKKDEIQAAYFPYIIRKYHIFEGKDVPLVIKTMLALMKESSLYCRENAIHALYIIGNADAVINALEIIDKSPYYHHSKLITDGMLEYTGDKTELSHRLWEKFHRFSEKMQVVILDYFRFGGFDHSERILHLLTAEDTSDEVKYSCIRYFGKFRYEPAYPYLIDLASIKEERYWEYAAIAATSLASYPKDKTKDILKEMLHSRNWYVRYNASMSLEALGVDYYELIDIFEGDDRYASEIMRYRFDQKRMKEKEASAV